MGQADLSTSLMASPINRRSYLRFEDDSFFPNADASRPLTGSSYLIDYMGLERARQSIGGNGVRAAVKVNTADSAADFEPISHRS